MLAKIAQVDSRVDAEHFVGMLYVVMVVVVGWDVYKLYSVIVIVRDNNKLTYSQINQPSHCYDACFGRVPVVLCVCFLVLITANAGDALVLIRGQYVLSNTLDAETDRSWNYGDLS